MTTAPTSGVSRPRDDHAVFVRIHMQCAARVAPRGLLPFRLAIHSAPATDDALDVLSGAGAANRQQPFFSLRRGDPRQRPDLRVRPLAARERIAQPRPPPHRAPRADPLARPATGEADAP